MLLVKIEAGEGRGTGRVLGRDGRPRTHRLLAAPSRRPPARRTEDEMAGLEEFPESACLHRVHRPGLEVHQDGSGDVFARGALAAHGRWRGRNSGSGGQLRLLFLAQMGL